MIDLDAIFCEPEPAQRPVINQSLPSNQKMGGDTEGRPGRALLYRFWDAGYTLQLVKSDINPTGFVIIPLGPIRSSQDLLAEYERHRDDAVLELLAACRVGSIDPFRWHEVVQAFIEAAEELEASGEAAKTIGRCTPDW